jgi:hypothetical protein
MVGKGGIFGHELQQEVHDCPYLRRTAQVSMNRHPDISRKCLAIVRDALQLRIGIRQEIRQRRHARACPSRYEMAIDIADFAGDRPFPCNAYQPFLLWHAHEASVIGDELPGGRIVQMRIVLARVKAKRHTPQLRHDAGGFFRSRQSQDNIRFPAAQGNGKAIRNACSQFIVLCRNLDLFSKSIVAIDGSKFKAVNNRDRNFTSAKVKARLQQIDESIAR